jgi:hypothetical protein
LAIAFDGEMLTGQTGRDPGLDLGWFKHILTP